MKQVLTQKTRSHQSINMEFLILQMGYQNVAEKIEILYHSSKGRIMGSSRKRMSTCSFVLTGLQWSFLKTARVSVRMLHVKTCKVA